MRFLLLFVFLFTSAYSALPDVNCYGLVGWENIFANPKPTAEFYWMNWVDRNLCPTSDYILIQNNISNYGCCVGTPPFYNIPSLPSLLSSSSALLSSSSDNGVVGGSDNGGGGSDIVLSAETVDSVIVAFNMGFQSGIAGFAPVVMLAYAILIAVYLFNYAVGRY